jgi:hypothetical protein
LAAFFFVAIPLLPFEGWTGIANSQRPAPILRRVRARTQRATGPRGARVPSRS